MQNLARCFTVVVVVVVVVVVATNPFWLLPVLQF